MLRRNINPRHLLVVAAAAAALLSATCSGDNTSSSDPITSQVLQAEPEADTSDIAADIEYIQDQEPTASDTQVADWIIEVIRWNNCLEQNPTGEGCTEISSDNPRH